jgi:hypothetical protein
MRRPLRNLARYTVGPCSQYATKAISDFCWRRATGEFSWYGSACPFDRVNRSSWDRFGVRRVAIAALPLLVIATYTLYLGTAHRPSALPSLSILADLGAGSVTLAPVAMIRAFPATVRFQRTLVRLQHHLRSIRMDNSTPRLMARSSESNQRGTLYKLRRSDWPGGHPFLAHRRPI